MQDRYLFRGKRIDSYNKEWVTGHYLSVPRPMIVLDELQPNGSWYWFEVDPATVGQCTGIKDKNGRLIFEGDILTHKTSSPNGIVVKFDRGSFRVGNHTILNRVETCKIVGNIHDRTEKSHGTTTGD